MSSAQVEKLIAVASADLGYKESPANSNKTKFGKWYGLDGQPWCMMAVQYWFNQSGLSHLLYRTASCTELMNYAKAKGQFHTSGFKPGDLALFDFDGDKRKSEHIGIILAVGIGTGDIKTIEGNTAIGNDSDGGEVMERKRPLSQIIGAYRPAYAEDKTETEDEEEMAIRYNKIAEVPAWAKPTIEKLVAKKYLQGDGNKLDLSEDMLRILVVNDRAGIYG